MKKQNQVAKVIGKTTLKYPQLSFGILFSVIGSVVVSLLPPLVLAHIIDRLNEGKELLVTGCVLYVLLIALTGILESARESLLIVFGQKITHALRGRLSEKLIFLEADTLNQQEPGNVVSRFVGDVNTVENLFTSGIISMFADVCKIISILVIIGRENAGLSGLLLLLLPLIFLFTRQVQKNMLAAEVANRVAVGRVTNHVPESVRCIRSIHTLGKEAYMEKRYEDYIGESYDAIEKTNFYDAVYSPVILIINAAVVALVMLLSASGNPKILAFFGMSVGTAVAIMNYIAQIFSPIESLGMEIQTIQSAVAGVSRINEFLSQKERKKYDTAEKRETQKAKEPYIEFCDVTFGYGEQNVLSHLSFAIDQEEQITFAGRTGAGKSTIFKLLLGLYRPEIGHVWVNGMEAGTIPDEKKRTIFGYVEQSFYLVPGTVRDQITLHDPAITEEMAEEAARLTGLHEKICSFPEGYDTVCVPGLFSQGQWQLLSIARAVAARPAILLLDEITANLDADTEATVLEALKQASRGRTVLSISHRMYEQSGGRIIEILLPSVQGVE